MRIPMANREARRNYMLQNDFPILEYDPSQEAIIEPSKYHSRVPGMPEHAVLCFFNDLVCQLAHREDVSEIHCLRSEMGRHPIYVVQGATGPAAVMHPCVGAPTAVALTEELIACGCNRIIACGGAGVLDSSLNVGQVLIPVSAVRDEGTSYHYLPPSRTVDASPEAVIAIEATLSARNVPHRLIKTWTTDAIYRETPVKIQRRKDEGCLTVEMEASALFALAQFRQVAMGYILYAGDDVSGAEWNEREWHKHRVRESLLELAIEACLRL
jgi:uridine phosphorylase